MKRILQKLAVVQGLELTPLPRSRPGGAASRVDDGVNVNVHLVRLGVATPWFYDGQRGRYAAKLDALARQAKAKRLGLWGACPRTVCDPYSAVDTRR